MVRYTLPTAILALSVGAWGSDTATLPMKGSVLNSDGGSNGQQVPDFKNYFKNVKKGLEQNKGKGKKGGKSKGDSSSEPVPPPAPEPEAPATVPDLPADTIMLNGEAILFPASEMIDAVDLRDIRQAEQGGTSLSGCAGSDFVRGPEGAAYEDGISLIKENNPTARAVSNAFHSDENIPNSMRASDWLWQWGQFVDHDYALGPETGEELDIDIPEGDEFYPEGMDHFETERTQAQFDIHGVLQQENVITSFIDAGNVYGNTNFRMEQLKANDGSGRMRTSEGNLLPLAGDDEVVQSLTARFGDSTNVVDIPHSEFFVGGDLRVNEHVNLITVHTLMHREHNYWADIIRAGNPDLAENKVFAYARVIVQAEVQKITYDEFLALLLGEHGLPKYKGFSSQVDPGALNLGAACAFRIGHTLISPSTSFVDESGTASVVPFADGFWNPNLHKFGGMDGFLRGLQTQVCQEVDVHMQSTLRNNLFAVRDDVPPRDLYALNVERAREHGIPNYNDIRKAYLGEEFGLPSGTDIFSDESVFLPEAGEILASIYDGPDSVDCFPGLLAEPHAPGAMVGPTHLAILSKQFDAIREGDEFWYQNRLEGELLEMIEATTLAQIVKRNSDEPGSLDNLPDNAFLVPE